MELNPEQRRDFERGLAIIEDRTASLNRFLQAYRQLAQMPPPVMKRVALIPIIERVVFLETRMVVTMSPGPDVMLMVDSDQIEQMLINLVRNAVEAAIEPSQGGENSSSSANDRECWKPQVALSWVVGDQSVEITIDDNGLWTSQSEQRVCAALYDQALGKWRGTGPLATDRRGARGVD